MFAVVYCDPGNGVSVSLFETREESYTDWVEAVFEILQVEQPKDPATAGVKAATLYENRNSDWWLEICENVKGVPEK
jgi:hypothetical protein